MKKLLKIVAIVIAVLIVSVLGYTYIAFNSYSPVDPEVEINQTAQQYFHNSYDESRSAFRIQANKIQTKFDSVQLFSRNVPSKIDNNLTIDFCYIPAQNETEKFIIITSGTHGVEGYVGSAVQQMFMNEILTDEMLDDVGVLLVHSVNPFGFKYSRRVTENNVDFNRNCDTEQTLFSSENEGYGKLIGMLNPEGKVNSGSLKNRFFMLVAINQLVRKSMASLRQAILQGQYEYPRGLYFGGTDFEPQIEILGAVFKEYATDYETVFNIDLHTGYGSRGEAHLFPNPIDDKKIKSGLENIFKGYEINWGDSDDFYIINGSFTDYIGKLLANKTYYPMVLEFGTLNSQSTVGSIKSIHNMVLENQGVQHGFKSAKDSLKIMHSFMEMYNPTSEKWRTKIMDDSEIMLTKTMENYADL
ncbi:MAG: M14 family metallopeptidase [Draconibacterium sp.]|nr:M14 family metallopeptidase [Draconibacterium sp.]